jgi:hypothetical protein
MKELLNDITAALRRRFDAMLDDAGKVDVVEFLFFLQNDIRLNQLATATQIQELWEHIRDKEVLVDFIHGGAQQMRFILGSEAWTSLIEDLSDAFTVHYEASIELTEEETIGEDLLERMASKANLKLFMTYYPWLVLVLLVDFLDLNVVLAGLRPEEEVA